jgi:hypothetical protein
LSAEPAFRIFEVWSPCGTTRQIRRFAPHATPSTINPIGSARCRSLFKDTMKTIAHTKPVKAPFQPSTPKQPRKCGTTWQPHQSSLTREEIRAIILEQIG